MKKKNPTYIFVFGGVMSGVGKGIATSSIGLILKSKGFDVRPIKIDPYLNVDAGTMNPTEHGETFVLDSGLETDQDMGNYERFLNLDLTNAEYITSGMVYQHVIEKERNLGYGGKTVEAIPHIRDEIIERIEKVAKETDVCLVEIGGTVGDYQNVMFIEAARVLRLKHPDNVLFILVSYVPIPNKVGEMKTRPTQNAVRQLNSYGIQPDMVIARAELPLDHKRKQKIAISCNIPEDGVISAPDIESIYDVPINFEKDKIGDYILKKLKLKPKKSSEGLSLWASFVRKMKNPKREINIAIVGKYFDTGEFVLSDSYVSVIEAIKFSSYHLGVKPVLTWLNSKDFESNKKKIGELKKYDGVIVPGGFGSSGVEGKIKVIQYCRINKIPYLGLCYGMQLAVVEYARNVVGMKGANTTEIDPKTSYPVIDILPEQKENLKEKRYGASMRLGARIARVKKNTHAYKAYKNEIINERHRHRYEVNPEYVKKIEEKGLIFSATSPNGVLMEIAELPKDKHPFFLGTQFHPELKARPVAPHPLFSEFVRAILNKKGI
jgi:CTP synthase